MCLIRFPKLSKAIALSWISCVLACSPIASDKVQVIFDTDMGSDCDDVGALALLHAYADSGLVDIKACIYSSGKIPFGVGVIDAINHYYGRPDIPIGASYEQEVGDTVDKMQAEKLALNTAAFGHRLIQSRDAEEQTRLNRQILVNAADTSIVYLTVGHTKGLYQLLTSEADDISPLNGRELITKKMKRWVALGALRAKNDGDYFTRDWNFSFNGTAPYTDYLVVNFPVEVVYISAGTEVMTGKSLVHTPPGNIVRVAYESWLGGFMNKTLEDQRPSWDLATVYYAVQGAGQYLQDVGSGKMEYEVGKGSRWQVDSMGTQRYVVQRPGMEEAFADFLNEMIARPPKAGR